MSQQRKDTGDLTIWPQNIKNKLIYCTVAT